MVENGDADGLFVIMRLAERERDYYFTDSVIQTSIGAFAEKSFGCQYAGPNDLGGCVIGVYGPSGAFSVVENMAKSMTRRPRIVQETDNATALRKLDAGRYGECGVAIMNVDLGNWLLKHEKIKNIQFLGEIQKTEYVFGLSRKKVSKELAEKFNASLHELIRNGSVREIAEKYGMKSAN